jgi:20S proteasome alpha/beta subunit
MIRICTSLSPSSSPLSSLSLQMGGRQFTTTTKGLATVTVLLIQLITTTTMMITIMRRLDGITMKVGVEAAHSRRRVVFRRGEESTYDKEITTFSPDGRLSQVEYGIEASLRGSTVGVLQVPTTSFCDESEVASMVDLAVCICIENSSFGKIHRIDHHLWLLTSGLSGDARMLAGLIRQRCQQHRLMYGEPPTTKEAATMAADFHHTLTRMGGCRPLGIASILVGVSDEEGGDVTTQVYQVDPGGSVVKCEFCAAGRGGTLLIKELQILAGQFETDKDKRSASSSPSGEGGNRGGGTLNLSTVAATMASTLLRQLDGQSNNRQPVVDVWTIQPAYNRRGGMLASCYRNVDKDTIRGTFLL